MNLQVEIVEAKDLPARDSNGLSDPYVHLQLGNTKFRTPVVYKNLNPKWNEKFNFKVENLKEELVLSLWDEDRFVDDFLGQVKIPVQSILEADKQKLPVSWHALQKRHPFFKAPVSGELRVGMSLSGKYCPPIQSEEIIEASSASSGMNIETRSIDSKFLTAKKSEPSMPVNSTSGQGNPQENAGTPYVFLKKITDLFVKDPEGALPFDDACIASEGSQTLIESFFDESDMIPLIISMDSLPPPLPGGILLDCSYAASVKALNAILFKPGCEFYRDFLSLQGATDIMEGPWRKLEDGCLQRIVTYRKPATKSIKAMNVTEEQTYIMADKTGFAVMWCVSIPGTLGRTFKTELLFTMTPLFDLSNSSTCLTISWRINFLQSTLLKSVIENEARKTLKNTYRQFAELLLKFVGPIDDSAAIIDKEGGRLPELLKPKSGREMAFEYFGPDDGEKQIGDSWLLSVTLVEGIFPAPVDSSKSSDPYVIFTCGGKTCHSSVKFQTSNPQWQEYFEFDAMEDPPSVMKVEAFNSEGLFAEEAASLGSKEIKFLNYTSEELADLWLLLEGNPAQSFGLRLRLQVFLTNFRTVHDIIGGSFKVGG